MMFDPTPSDSDYQSPSAAAGALEHHDGRSQEHHRGHRLFEYREIGAEHPPR